MKVISCEDTITCELGRQQISVHIALGVVLEIKKRVSSLFF